MSSQAILQAQQRAQQESHTQAQIQNTSTNSPKPPKRIGQLIRLKPAHAQEYIRIHSSVWPGVLNRIAASHIHDYSIFYDEPLGLLFASFKYSGDDWEGDMKKIAKDEETLRWWEVTDGMQESLNEGAQGSKEGRWWREMREVFYFEGAER